MIVTRCCQTHLCPTSARGRGWPMASGLSRQLPRSEISGRPLGLVGLDRIRFGQLTKTSLAQRENPPGLSPSPAWAFSRRPAAPVPLPQGARSDLPIRYPAWAFGSVAPVHARVQRGHEVAFAGQPGTTPIYQGATCRKAIYAGRIYRLAIEERHIAGRCPQGSAEGFKDQLRVCRAAVRVNRQ